MRLGSRRILCVSTKSRKRATVFFLLTVFLISVLTLLCYGFYILRPNVVSMAKSRAKEIATLKINSAVSEKLQKENFSTDNIVKFSYNESGEIVSATSDVAYASKLKSDLAIEVTEAIRAISKEELLTPLGSLSGIDILYGMGPDIPIEIKPYGYAVADIKTNFYDAGINQTAYEVTAEITASVSVLMPTVHSGVSVSTSVPMVTAVVVGKVPQNYTNVERHGEEYEDDVLELLE